MALNLVSPGVNIREVDLTIGGITAGSNQVGAIAGPFQKGPVNEPILIETENDLLNVFGKPISSDSQYEYWLSASSFLSYGGILRVVRCDGDNLKTANAGVAATSVSLKIESVEDYDNNHTSDTNWYWASRNPGSWANKLKVCVIDGLADQRIAISTSGLAVGYGVSTSYTRSFGGIGTVTSETGVLKGIITQVNSGSIDVKILSKNVGGVDNEVSYQQGGTYEFKAADSVGINSGGTLVRVESSSVSNISVVVSTGSSVVLPGPSVTGATPFASAGYTVGQFVKSISGSLVPGNTIVGFGTTNVNGSTQDTLLLSDGGTITGGTSTIGVFNATTSISAPLDWYDQQTLGLENSTVYWKNIAPKPGTSQYAAERSSKNDEINIVVVDDTGAVTGAVGNVLEKYQRVSKASDGRISPNQAIYYKDIIRRQSQYVFAGFAETGTKTKFSTLSGYSDASNTIWGLEAQGNTFNCVGAKTYTLSGGADYSGTLNVGGYSVELSDVVSSYRKFTNPAEYSIDYLISGPSGGTTVSESQAKANELIAIADLRKDCIAVISPHRSGVVNVSNSETQTNNIIEFFDPLTSSSYAVFDSGYKYTYDRFNSTFRYIPCNADVAGLMARTANNSFPWYSPAGANRGAINNATKLAYNPSQAQRDRLYTKRINPIIFSQGAGIILFGDKTALSYTSAFDRINVRRLFLTIEKAIERAARAQLFEFNDLITRSNFINIVEPYLRDVKAKRGITDFVVICDETNNTPDVIDSNQFKADIYVKPARSINFIGLTFVATRTGVSFEEVIGTV
jgi:phage tail sheath protein FI